MKRLIRLILAGVLLCPAIGFMASCSEEADCSMNERAMTNCGIYTIDADGMWKFKPVAANGTTGVFTLTKATHIDNLDANTYEVTTGAVAPATVKVASDVVVVDVTNDATANDNIMTFTELLERTKTDEAFTCYYMDENADGVISLLYVQANA